MFKYFGRLFRGFIKPEINRINLVFPASHILLLILSSSTFNVLAQKIKPSFKHTRIEVGYPLMNFHDKYGWCRSPWNHHTSLLNNTYNLSFSYSRVYPKWIFGLDFFNFFKNYTDDPRFDKADAETNPNTLLSRGLTLITLTTDRRSELHLNDYTLYVQYGVGVSYRIGEDDYGTFGRFQFEPRWNGYIYNHIGFDANVGLTFPITPNLGISVVADNLYFHEKTKTERRFASPTITPNRWMTKVKAGVYVDF